MSSMRQSSAANRSAFPEHPAGQESTAAKSVRQNSTGWRRDALRRRLVAGADVSAVLVAILAFGFERGSGIGLAGFLALVAGAAVFSAKILGLYDRDHRLLWHTTADELAGIATWAATVTTGLVVLLLSASDPMPEALALIGFMVAAGALDVGLRSAARRLWRQVTPPERVLILGSGPIQQAVRRKFELFHHLHLELVASVSETKLLGLTGGTSGRDFSLPEGIAPGSVDRLLVAVASPDEMLMAKLVPYCRQHEIKLGLVPPARGMFGTAVQLDHVAELPIVQYNTWNVSRSTMLGKRLLDVLLSAASLIALLPVLLVVAVAIKFDSRGPVLFRQRRAGQNGDPFKMLKFRSMGADAESRLSEVVELDSLTDPVFKLRHDPRATRVGRFLRRSSIDELPQLWNVLRGDMSLVGPRPEELALVARYPPEAREVRLAVKPGLTGPMQVYGRGSLTFDERVAVEREYVENLSLTRDVRILGMTLSAVVGGQGAI